jgi:WD40 repeat protein
MSCNAFAGNHSTVICDHSNFLILLGNRYGWRPLPEEISQVEFETLVTAATSGGDKHSAIFGTHGKTAEQVLRDWYRCDENVRLSDPAEVTPDRAPLNYILQPRTQSLGDGRDYTRTNEEPQRDTQDWQDVQQVLWRIINAAFPAEALDHRFENIDWTRHASDVCDRVYPKRAIPQIARFQSSATEQEIWGGALSAENAERHVLAFFRDIANGDEFSRFDLTDFFDFTDSGDIDRAAASRQSALKEAISRRLGKDAVSTIPFMRLTFQDDKVVVDASEAGTREFCGDVEKRMQLIIERQIEQYWHKTSQSSVERTVRELKIEQQEHARFGWERGGAESFVGRDAELEAIRDYLLNECALPLVVHGASGCGKTALMARAAQEAGIWVQSSGTAKNEESGTKNGSVICVRFIGTTPCSSDLRGLLTSLCQELRLQYPREDDLPTNINLLEVELHDQFKAATPEQPLIVFLDALDQLADTDGGRLLHWITVGPLPAHVKLVVSCLSDRTGERGGEPWTELQRRQLPEGNYINLDSLSEDEARTLLFERWLPRVGRTVNRDQRAWIEQRLASDACRQPIYLKLLFEEARLWHSYDAVSKLGGSVPALLGQLFRRLGRRENHGPLLVERVLGYLAASRHGLSENEILEVLFDDPKYKAELDQAAEQTRHELPANATRIPIAIWSRLRFDLAPYLTECAAVGANVLTFYHRQVAEWVQKHFVKASDQSCQPHQLLADYFTTCARGTDPQRNWETDSVRGFAECVFQLIKAGQDEQAGGLLNSFPFLLHKLRAGLLEGLFEDYDLIRSTASAEVVRRLEIWADFFCEKAHILRRGYDEWPVYKILLQLALEHADDSPITLKADKWLKEKRCNWLWLRRVPTLPHVQQSPCLAVLEGHKGWIKGALVLSDNRLLSWSKDTTLRVWDGRSSVCQLVLEGHSEEVSGALVLPDGRLLSWSEDTTLRVWDGWSYTCLAVLAGHTGGISGALVLPDGRLLSWSEDTTLRVWDGRSSVCQLVLKGHSEEVSGALVLPDRRLLSWSGDITLRLWNGRSGTCLAVLAGHKGRIEGALVLPDGRLLSWSRDRTLRLWNGRSGTCLAVLAGHSDYLAGALALPDGRLLSWSMDDTLRVWEGRSSACLAVLAGHSSMVNGAMVLPNGDLLSWSEDKTLRVWDGRSSVCLAVLAGHSGGVEGVLSWPDGRLLSWASGRFSNDNSLRLWEGRNRSRVEILEGHSVGVNGTLVLPDSQLLSWAGCELRLWNGRSGSCLAVLEGHKGWIKGALVLPDGRLLSWSWDDTLRLWDGRSSACLAVLEGHNRSVLGALVLPDGRLLSWSMDETLRLWNGRNGSCLAVLEGHKGWINGALVLPDGRLLSWARRWLSNDDSLRLWDGRSGICLEVLDGHSDGILGALVLPDGRLLSWSWDKTLRVWDGRSGAGLEVMSEATAANKHPNWLHARKAAEKTNAVVGDYFADSMSGFSCLRHKTVPSILAGWEADSDSEVPCLLPDGTVVVTQENGQVCFLKLHHGQRRISLAEAEAFLASERKKGE